VALSIEPFCMPEPVVIPPPLIPELPVPEPVFESLRAAPPAVELPAALLLPPAWVWVWLDWAIANEIESASAHAVAIIVFFMCLSCWTNVLTTEACNARSARRKLISLERRVPDTGEERPPREILYGLGRALNASIQPRRIVAMPQYFFNVRNHINTEDYEGTNLIDLDAARMEAQKDVIDIKKCRSPAVGTAWSQWSIEICDRQRKVLMVVPFSQN
jgi:hypothetical protein